MGSGGSFLLDLEVQHLYESKFKNPGALPCE